MKSKSEASLSDLAYGLGNMVGVGFLVFASKTPRNVVAKVAECLVLPLDFFNGVFLLPQHEAHLMKDFIALACVLCEVLTFVWLGNLIVRLWSL